MSLTNVIFPFADPGSSYTMMDNHLFDYIMPAVKPNAWKILCLIIRKTRGWHKITDQISFSQIKIGTGIVSDETVNNALKQLVKKGYILVKKGGQWDATEYAINTSYSTTKIEVEKAPATEIEVVLTTKIEAVPTTKIEDTKERERKGKKRSISAAAEFSKPISFLSEKEVKGLKLTLTEWKQYLLDEQAERNRKGVIGFIENKLLVGPLLPDTSSSQLLFDKLEREAEARGRNPPVKFPTLACKGKFDLAAAKLNGTLESAIDTALQKGIVAIPKLVSYIASPKWQEKPKNEHTGTRTSKSEAPRQTGHNQDPLLGSGQSAQTRAKLKQAFSRSATP